MGFVVFGFVCESAVSLVVGVMASLIVASMSIERFRRHCRFWVFGPGVLNYTNEK